MAELRLVQYCLIASMAGMKGVTNYGTSKSEECPIGSLSLINISFHKSFIHLNVFFMEKLREHAAGIDIGAKKIFIGLEDDPVKSFDTFTESFYMARDYLVSKQIQTVAMEATGVYWIILYEILESAGLDVWLVDGRQTRQVPGRKTDVRDCQWIQQLHSYGLLNRCFVPDEQVKEVRSYQRLREDHIRSASMHINHMQKALTEMNIRLKEVLSQIHGASGLAIIKAIIEGERNADKLLKLCHISVRKKKADQILKALEGHYTKSGLFALNQAYQAYVFYQQQIADCDRQLQETMEKVNNFHKDEDVKKEIESATGRKPIRHNRPEHRFSRKIIARNFSYLKRRRT